MADDLRQELWTFAKALAGVEERTSESADIPALFVGRIEFLHSHAPSALDLRLPPPIVPLELAKGGARRHPIEHAARDGWVIVDVPTAQDVARAKELIARGYEGAASLART